ncbi:hypothetical protein SAICODRAFT_5629 [Saitoella complicata NRRL Y-17804]|nr:uncharacterized protein SAICODRAFT_5629 [Saitoella complicata NRRL Y-17804]ODQ55013.1 hypothetical protein SAICODRAFT_5629 [Saitoella complicata NRRL Y-17804]
MIPLLPPPSSPDFSPALTKALQTIFDTLYAIGNNAAEASRSAAVDAYRATVAVRDMTRVVQELIARIDPGKKVKNSSTVPVFDHVEGQSDTIGTQSHPVSRKNKVKACYYGENRRQSNAFTFPQCTSTGPSETTAMPTPAPMFVLDTPENVRVIEEYHHTRSADDRMLSDDLELSMECDCEQCQELLTSSADPVEERVETTEELRTEGVRPTFLEFTADDLVSGFYNQPQGVASSVYDASPSSDVLVDVGTPIIGTPRMAFVNPAPSSTMSTPMKLSAGGLLDGFDEVELNRAYWSTIDLTKEDGEMDDEIVVEMLERVYPITWQDRMKAYQVLATTGQIALLGLCGEPDITEAIVAFYRAWIVYNLPEEMKAVPALKVPKYVAEAIFLMNLHDEEGRIPQTFLKKVPVANGYQAGYVNLLRPFDAEAYEDEGSSPIDEIMQQSTSSEDVEESCGSTSAPVPGLNMSIVTRHGELGGAVTDIYEDGEASPVKETVVDSTVLGDNKSHNIRPDMRMSDSITPPRAGDDIFAKAAVSKRFNKDFAKVRPVTSKDENAGPSTLSLFTFKYVTKACSDSGEKRGTFEYEAVHSAMSDSDEEEGKKGGRMVFRARP